MTKRGQQKVRIAAVTMTFDILSHLPPTAIRRPARRRRHQHHQHAHHKRSRCLILLNDFFIAIGGTRSGGGYKYNPAKAGRGWRKRLKSENGAANKDDENRLMRRRPTRRHQERVPEYPQTKSFNKGNLCHALIMD